MQMNKKGLAASSTPVIWAVAIVGLILLIAGFFFVSNVNQNIDQNVADLGVQVDADLDAAIGSINTAVASIPTAVAEGLVGTGSTGATDTSSDEICTNTDGCNGLWDVVNNKRGPMAERVLEELTDDDNKDLFRAMEKDGIDINDDDDIDDAWVENKGEMLTDQDPRFGTDEDKTATIDIVIGVDYIDGDGHEKTDYFRVQATISEMENFLDDADVEINEFDEVRKRFALPHR